MDHFAGKIAVVTGGGTGMGRELARQLAAEGCHVAMCDVSATAMADTQARARTTPPAGTVVSTFVADVSDEAQLLAFRDAGGAAHATDHVDLLFNNAGIGGGGSLVRRSRDEWEHVFGVCWGGVYFGTRTFLPLLLASDEGHVVNTSSVNGFWASLGGNAHTAYSAAKFAVKGFTEALITDFRAERPAPAGLGRDAGAHRDVDRVQLRRLLRPRPEGAHRRAGRRAAGPLRGPGPDVTTASDEDIRNAMLAMAEGFRDNAPMTAAQAATIILDGVRAGDWRILVGDDAQVLDEAVRADPADAYEPEFMDRLRGEGIFGGLPTKRRLLRFVGDWRRTAIPAIGATGRPGSVWPAGAPRSRQAGPASATPRATRTTINAALTV